MGADRELTQPSVKDVYHPFLIVYQGHLVHLAGLPPPDGSADFRRLFPRDGLVKEQLDPERVTMEGWLRFCASRMGTKINPQTGEKPGDIPHEIDPKTDKGVELSWAPGLTTEYNAADNKAHWLNTLKLHQELFKTNSLVIELKPYVLQVSRGIMTEVNTQGLHTIDPKQCGAERFALRVTYWKDSLPPGRKNASFNYPAVITLAHVQNMIGLESGAALLDSLPEAEKDKRTEEVSKKAKKTAQQMRMALMENLYDSKNKTWFIALDQEGPITGISSDSLHALYYIKPGELDRRRLREVLESAYILESQAGFLGIERRIGDTLEDDYHAIVWPFENAIINVGIRNHLDWTRQRSHTAEADLLEGLEIISLRPFQYFNGSKPETLDPRSGVVKKGGCDPQLWSVAAEQHIQKHYPHLYIEGHVENSRLAIAS